MSAKPLPSRRLVLLVGAFRRCVPEGGQEPIGSQGGFIDTLAPSPYSFANGSLKAFALADPEVASRFDIELLDLVQRFEIDDAREEVLLTAQDCVPIIDRHPDVVGFSAYCWNLEAILFAARELKQACPQCLVVVGGRATEGAPEQLLRDQPSIDALIVGEGEIAFRELLRCHPNPPDAIAGLLVRRGERIISAGPSQAVQNLDDIPSPYQASILTPAPHAVILELSRGCLHACGYCTWNACKTLRFHSADAVAADVAWALEHGHRHITLADSAINYDTKVLHDWVDAIEQTDPRHRIQFTYNVRHDCLTQEQFELLHRIPTHMVLCGIESLAPGSLDHVDRAQADIARLHATLQQLAAAVRPPVVSIVLGLPADSESGFRSTLDTLLSWSNPHPPEARPAVGAVLVSLLQVYRGSSLWNQRDQLGLQFSTTGIPYLLSSPGWPAEALARAKTYLVQRMTQMPDELKAAEGIVLLQSEGGIDPWIALPRIESLVHPWKVGRTEGGWTLENIGIVRDHGRAAALRFRYLSGGGVRIRLSRKTAGNGSPLSTSWYDLQVNALEGPRAPEASTRALVQHLRAVITYAERRLAARATHRAR